MWGRGSAGRSHQQLCTVLSTLRGLTDKTTATAAAAATFAGDSSLVASVWVAREPSESVRRRLLCVSLCALLNGDGWGLPFFICFVFLLLLPCLTASSLDGWRDTNFAFAFAQILTQRGESMQNTRGCRLRKRKRKGKRFSRLCYKVEWTQNLRATFLL